MIRILYFARLRERLGTDTEQVELAPGMTDVAGLTTWLRERGGVWAETFGPVDRVLIAINQQMASGQTPIHDGDEVAFFPPVTGG